MKRTNILTIMICLGINIAIACLAIFVFGTNIYIKDDYTICYMAYGIMSEASSRVYYSNAILGWIYKHLFELIPKFNWQTFIHYLGLVFAGTVGLYTVQKKDNKVFIALWFIFEIVFFHDVYVVLTFSVVAAYAACQGYLALFMAVNEERVNGSLCAVSGLVLVFSSLARFDSFIGISGFAFVSWFIFTYTALQKKMDTSEVIKRYLYPFATIIGVCFILYGIDRFSYTKGDWKLYKERESAISIVTDYRDSPNMMDLETLSELGINESMTRAVIEWRSNDPEILTTDVFERMAETRKKYNYLTSPYVWKDYNSQWGVIFTDYREVYFALLVLGYLMFSVWDKEKNIVKCLPMLLLVPFFLEFFYFAFIGRLDGGEYTDRSIYTVLMGLAMGALSLYGVMANGKKIKSYQSKIWIVIMLLAAISVFPTRDFKPKGLGLVDARSISEKYGFLGNPGKVYICDYSVSTLIADSYGAWQTPDEGFMDQCVFIGDWLVGHPMRMNQQIALGAENPYRALFENEDVYYATKKNFSDMILKYLQENYDDRISLTYIKEKGELKIFKFSLEKQ